MDDTGHLIVSDHRKILPGTGILVSFYAMMTTHVAARSTLEQPPPRQSSAEYSTDMPGLSICKRINTTYLRLVLEGLSKWSSSISRRNNYLCCDVSYEDIFLSLKKTFLEAQPAVADYYEECAYSLTDYYQRCLKVLSSEN